LIVAISAVSESGDHYLFCETGTIGEIIYSLHHCDDFAYFGQVRVMPLQPSEHDSAEQLRIKLVEAIDKAYDSQ
jgi:hypothetical protein